MLGLRSGSLDVLPSSAKKAILSVDYDWREQRVFWVSLDTDSIRWSSLDYKSTGTLIKGWCNISIVEQLVLGVTVLFLFFLSQGSGPIL